MATSRDTRLVIGPNASLSERQAWGFMILTCAVGLGIAGGFAAMGLWPVLPFAGLELGALGVALYICMKCNRYREVLTFAGDTLRIEFGELDQGVAVRIELPRAWTRAELENGEHRHDRLRLLLCNSGQRIEIGRCLTDEERERLCARIKELLQPARHLESGGAGVKPAQEFRLGD